MGRETEQLIQRSPELILEIQKKLEEEISEEKVTLYLLETVRTEQVHERIRSLEIKDGKVFYEGKETLEYNLVFEDYIKKLMECFPNNMKDLKELSSELTYNLVSLWTAFRLCKIYLESA